MKQAAKNNLHGITVDEDHLIIRTDAEKNGIKAVCKDLGKQSCSIKRFSLMKLPGEAISKFVGQKYVAKALAKNTSITALEIDTTGSEEDAEYLKAIKDNPKSSIVNLRIGLHENKLTNIFCTEFVGLKLTDLEVTAECAMLDELLNACANMGTLKSFLCEGQVGTNELTQLFIKNQDLEHVAVKCHRLVYFDLGRTIGISHQIAKTLAALPNLKTLKLQFDLSPEEAEMLIVGLKGNKTITELSIDQYWFVHDFRSSVTKKIDALSSMTSLRTFRMTNFGGLTYFTGTNIELLNFAPLFTLTGSIKTLDCYFATFDTDHLFRVIEQGTCLEQIILQHDENIDVARGLFEVCRRRNPFIMLVTKGLELARERSALKQARVNLFRSLLTLRILLTTKESVVVTQLPPEIFLMILTHMVHPVEISLGQCEGLISSLACRKSALTIRQCWTRSFFFFCVGHFHFNSALLSQPVDEILLAQ